MYLRYTIKTYYYKFRYLIPLIDFILIIHLFLLLVHHVSNYNYSNRNYKVYYSVRVLYIHRIRSRHIDR